MCVYICVCIFIYIIYACMHVDIEPCESEDGGGGRLEVLNICAYRHEDTHIDVHTCVNAYIHKFYVHSGHKAYLTYAYIHTHTHRCGYRAYLTYTYTHTHTYTGVNIEPILHIHTYTHTQAWT